jgi:gag-polypeptide of LTR copia-type/Zinc knuckle
MHTIADLYAPSSSVHVVTMRKDLGKLQMAEHERVSKYMDRAKGIHRDLVAAGDSTTEEFVVTQLLMGLRPEFHDEAKHLHRTNVPHTFAAIARPLRDAERAMVAMGTIVYPDTMPGTAIPPAGYAALLDYSIKKHALDDDADVDADVLYAAGGKRRKGGQGRPVPLGGDTHTGLGRPVHNGHGGPAAGGSSVTDVGDLITPELIARAMKMALNGFQRGGGARRGNGSAGNRHNPDIVCMRCQQKGHIARDCMAPRPVSAAQGGRASGAGASAIPPRVHFAMPSMHDLPGPLDGAPDADGQHVHNDEHAH